MKNMQENPNEKPVNEPKHRWMWPRHSAGHWILWLIGFVILVLVAGAAIFHLAFGRYGDFIREKYARFGYDMPMHQDDHYGFMRGGMMYGGGAGYGNGYNATVKSVTASQIVVTASNGVEQTLQITPQTIISRAGNSIQLSGLKSGDIVTVWGYQTGSGIITATNIQAQ